MRAGAGHHLIAATLVAASLGGCGSTAAGTSSVGADSSTGPAASSSTPSVPSHRAPVRRPVRRPRPAPAAGLGRRTRTSGCRVRGQLPDPACTPGAVFAAATVAEICTPGYASGVRNVPEALKRTVYADYGTEPSVPGSYEVDHLVPLELGGSNEIANLWPEIAPGYHEKDQVENELHDAVCAGHIGLASVQRAIARDWRHAGVPVPSPGSGAGTPVSPGSGSGASGAEGPGSSTHAGDAAFCSTHSCIANFPHGRGTVVQCADGRWSHSGGLTGVCNRHGGPR
ncbi:MAG TPA: hypothetical protein VNR66_05570 [Solirubrobacteraceae bacterium]|nr:hypothetical protein [Solirubrobacteraceae bacterium]